MIDQLLGLSATDWAMILSMTGVAFGVGFWGGIALHSHGGIADGGTLTTYQRLLGNSVVIVAAANTIAQTTVSPDYVIPANTLAPGDVLILSFGLLWVQNTGVAANDPTIAIFLNGGQAMVQNSGQSYASQITPRPIGCELLMTVINSTNLLVQGRLATIDTNTDIFTSLSRPGDTVQFGTFGGLFNTAIANTFNIRITNAVASVNYTVTHRNSMMRKIGI